MFSWLKGKKKPAATPSPSPDDPKTAKCDQQNLTEAAASAPNGPGAAEPEKPAASTPQPKEVVAATSEPLGGETAPTTHPEPTPNQQTADDIDPVLAPLTVAAGQIFRTKFIEHLASCAVTATAVETHAHTDTGAQLGYDSLLQACLETGDQDSWDAVMKEYCGKVAEALQQSTNQEDSFAKLGPEAVICKLIAPERFEEFGTESYGYGPKFADELPVVATLDSESMTSYLPAEVISESSTVNAAIQSGLSNLANLIDSAELDFEHHTDSGITITFVGGPSVYTASFALFLPLVIHRIQPEADLSKGVLFTLTEDHRITYHICQQSELVHHATVDLVRMAHQQSDDAERMLSPHVYFYRNSVTSVLRCAVEDGAVRITASEHFTEAWNELAQE